MPLWPKGTESPEPVSLVFLSVLKFKDSHAQNVPFPISCLVRFETESLHLGKSVTVSAAIAYIINNKVCEKWFYLMPNLSRITLGKSPELAVRGHKNHSTGPTSTKFRK